jgi:hypothetical protein
MATLAGMDLGFGSAVKIVRTNFLFVEVSTNTGTTAQAFANLMHVYNRIQGEGSLLKADYIVPVVANAEVTPASGTDSVVADLNASMLAPLVGPSRAALATASGLDATGDSAAETGPTAGASILAIVNTALISFGGAGFTTPAAVELLATTVNHAEAMNAALLADSAGGPVYFVDMTDIATDATATGTLSATGDCNVTVAALNASFAMKGNATGAAETTVADFTTPVASSSSLVSITALVRTAQ